MPEDGFCCTLFEALNDLGRVGGLGRPEEQVKVLGHQNPAENAKALLYAQRAESGHKLLPESMGIKKTRPAIGAGGQKVGMIQSIIVQLARHEAILHSGNRTHGKKRHVCATRVQSVDRIIFSIFNRFNEDWRNRILQVFTQAA